MARGEGRPTRSSPKVAVVSALLLLTFAGGALDAWTFVGHGRVFANSQTGNVVLIAVALGDEAWSEAVRRLPSLASYIAGLVGSRLLGSWLKRRGMNSRALRLALEAGLLVGLAFFADVWSNAAVTSCAGFIAALQITSLSRIGAWSFNTGMTTGNMRSAAVAFVAVLDGKVEERARAYLMVGLCLAFGMGAVAGGWLAPRIASATLLIIAFAVACAAQLSRRAPDPLPAWTDL